MSNVTKFSLTASTLGEAIEYSKLISNSSFVPKDFRGKPEDVLVAVQWGAELGLAPMQALQNIAVVNGRPSIWGDAALAIVQQHRDFEYIKETIEQDQGGNHRAICRIKRRGNDEHISTFTVEDAKRAGLWGKAGPWTQYSKRMLQLRARGFALRDMFADALKGIITREEAVDYPSQLQDVTPTNQIIEVIEDKRLDENQEVKTKADRLADTLVA